MKCTVIYHNADFDGIFCREIAKHFLPKDTEFIGWNHGDPVIPFPWGNTVYVMDLSPECFNQLQLGDPELKRIIWIDHHKTSMDTYEKYHLAGYRLDGVAACRLAWQWFKHSFNMPADVADHERSAHWRMWMAPKKEDFKRRKVDEPYAVTLAGEYDVHDQSDPTPEKIQNSLRSQSLDELWPFLLSTGLEFPRRAVTMLLEAGRGIAYVRKKEYEEVITQQGFDVQFEGLNYLACNSHGLDIRSALFEAGVQPKHQGLLGFTWTGKEWRVSLYGIPGHDIDHSQIAKKYGGGGHKGACGFRTKVLPFL